MLRGAARELTFMSTLTADGLPLTTQAATGPPLVSPVRTSVGRVTLAADVADLEEFVVGHTRRHDAAGYTTWPPTRLRAMKRMLPEVA